MADIVTEVPLTEAIVSNVELWASCIGGAPEQRAYQEAMASAGLKVQLMKSNPYEFLSDQAKGVSERYGVKSVSVLAVKEA